jgi:hypothetical protein
MWHPTRTGKQAGCHDVAGHFNVTAVSDPVYSKGGGPKPTAFTVPNRRLNLCRAASEDLNRAGEVDQVGVGAQHCTPGA